MITSLIDWLVNIISTLGYLGVFISMFLESFFAPIPSEVILPFSGFVAYSGALNIYLVILFATIAAYLGSLPFYFLGHWGNKYVYSFIDKYGKYLFIYREDLDMVNGLFSKYGNKLVFFGRLIPIARTLVSFPAGTSKMNFMLFSIYTVIGTFIWSTILALAGYLLGENWNIVQTYVSKYEHLIIGLGVIVCILFIFKRVIPKLKEA